MAAERANRPSRLVLLCGTGTTGCHGWVGTHPAAAEVLGLVVRRGSPVDPADVPMRTPLGWRLLDDTGGWKPGTAPSLVA